MTKHSEGKEEVNCIIGNARKAQIVDNDILDAPIFSDIVPKVSVLRIGHLYRVELSAVTAKKGL
jgi:hypothetical protein